MAEKLNIYLNKINKFNFLDSYDAQNNIEMIERTFGVTLVGALSLSTIPFLHNALVIIAAFTGSTGLQVNLIHYLLYAVPENLAIIALYLVMLKVLWRVDFSAMKEMTIDFIPKEDLLTLRHVGSYLQGHPCMQHIPGVDMSSGSLGQGISAAVGMAISAKLTNDDYRVYTLLGDGEIQEGQVWEAAMLAGHRKLDNLVVIVDNNGLQIDGNIADVNSPYPIDKKFEAFNFHVINIDGHNFKEIAAALKEARETKGQPTAIIAKTIKGKDVSFMENNAGWHGKAPNDEEFEIAMADLEKVGEALCQK